MSRSNGGLIAVKFDKKLIGDVTGRYPPVAGGPVEKLVIPALRSDGTKIFKDSVIYTDSVSYGGSLPTNAFDTSTSTYWSSMGTLPQWLQIDLGEGNAVLATKFRYYSGATYRIGEYKFEGSTDGLTWNLLWTGINDDTTGWRDITFVNTILYRFYRWTILTGRTAGNIYIYEL